jgi:hypothetical protein
MRGITLCAMVLASTVAHAHGGLPVSLAVVHQPGSNTLYVPVVFWGLWVGSDGGPWTWICEEKINTYRTRKYAVSSNGTFYATDTRGLTRSTDQGCTWTAVTGELATRRVPQVSVDPDDGSTAFAVTADGVGTDDDGGALSPDNALYVTHDRGANFMRLPGLAAHSTRLLQTVMVAPGSGKIVYVASADPLMGSGPAIHRSGDAGMSFTTHAIANTIDGAAPYALEILAVDPRDANVVYLRGFATVAGAARQVLLRSIDGGASFAEILKQDGVSTPSGLSKGIDGVAIDVPRNKVYVATSMGMYAGSDTGGAAAVTLAKTGNLSQAQCVEVRDGKIFACSNNYDPDQAALARSDDGAQSFKKVFQYYETQGPVSCPKGTPVGDDCPFYWETYGTQLGILFDGGIGDGGKPPDPPGCGCDVGGRPAGLAVAAVAVALAGVWLAARRARRPRDRA